MWLCGGDFGCGGGIGVLVLLPVSVLLFVLMVLVMSVLLAGSTFKEKQLNIACENPWELGTDVPTIVSLCPENRDFVPNSGRL